MHINIQAVLNIFYFFNYKKHLFVKVVYFTLKSESNIWNSYVTCFLENIQNIDFFPPFFSPHPLRI